MLGDIRLTVRESTPDIDEDLYLIENGSARFAEDDTTVPGNDADALRSIPNGMIFAEVGNVLLQVGDDVHTHQNSRDLANGNIDIYGDWTNLDTGGLDQFGDVGGNDQYGTTMILRGRIVADCRVTSNGDADNSGPPGRRLRPEIARRPGEGDEHLGQHRRRHLPVRRPDPASTCAGGSRRLRGCSRPRATATSSSARTTGDPRQREPRLRPATDGEDQFIVWYLQSMNVVGTPGDLGDATTAPGTR